MEQQAQDILGHMLVQIEQLTRRFEASEKAHREESAAALQAMRKEHASAMQAMREEMAAGRPTRWSRVAWIHSFKWAL